jgi:Putative sugar-binding domain
VVPLRQRHDERAQTTAHYPRRPAHRGFSPARRCRQLRRPRPPGRPHLRWSRPFLLRPHGRARPGRYGSVTKAVVGVGLWAPGESTVYDVTDEKVRRELHQRGVCAEIGGVLIDADGHRAESNLTEGMIGVSAAQLRAIPEVIGLAYSTARSPAVQAAIRGGFIKCLVTHPSLARTLLVPQENRPQPDPPGKGDLARVANPYSSAPQDQRQVGSSPLTASRSSD